MFQQAAHAEDIHPFGAEIKNVALGTARDPHCALFVGVLFEQPA